MKTKPATTWTISLLAILFFHMICESMAIPVLVPTLAEPISPAFDLLPNMSMQAHKIFYGICLAIYPVAVFICAPVIGAISDTMGRKPILIIMLIGTIIGSLAQSVGMQFLSLWLFMLGRLLVGATAGIDGVIQAALIDKCNTQAQKNRYLGMTLLAMSLGFILGPAFSAILIDDKSQSNTWAIPFFTLSLFFILSTVSLIFSYKTKAKIKSYNINLIKQIQWAKGLSDILKLRRSKDASRLITIFVLNQVSAGIATSVIPLILTESYAFSFKEISFFISIMGIFCTLIFAFGDRFISKFSVFSVLKFSFFISFICILITGIKVSDSFIWLFVILFPMGFSMAYFSFVSIFSQSVKQCHSGWILSVISSLWGLTAGIGMALCGLLAAYSNYTPIFVAGIFCIIAILLALKESKIPNIQLD